MFDIILETVLFLAILIGFVFAVMFYAATGDVVSLGAAVALGAYIVFVGYDFR